MSRPFRPQTWEVHELEFGRFGKDEDFEYFHPIESQFELLLRVCVKSLSNAKKLTKCAFYWYGFIMKCVGSLLY